VLKDNLIEDWLPCSTRDECDLALVASEKNQVLSDISLVDAIGSRIRADKLANIHTQFWKVCVTTAASQPTRLPRWPLQ
jgi:hypothetical protein